ncbi:hypothetical protein SKAU_G00045890 [Synaphobranchus kaupii]|uniref:Protein piccolo n=1 Tax=Synaphobranchus kaupii TaxID=118154 RepID=A0A9Q1J735_SYNKA|nr:hypothetical protein SKAU_G00045890 [Synaphobranchus kaupii]
MPPPMHTPTKPQQPAPPKSQPSPAKQPTTQVTAPVIAADAPPKTALDQPKTDLAKATALAHTVPTPPPDTGATRTTAVDHAPLQKPKDATNAAERKKEEKGVEVVETEVIKMKPEAATQQEKEGKFETSGSSQQKSPQGLSDTGYSSEGISGSLGEIPSVVQTKEKEPLIEPVQKDTVKQDTSPTSPSDLAKLESTVLPLLEAQTSRIEKEDPCSNYGVEKEQHRKKILPVSSESYSSGEEALQVAQEMDASFAKELHGESVTRKDRKKLHILTEAAPGRRQRSDSVEDSSESEPSPLLQRRRKISTTSSSSEDYKKDSPCSGDEEEFIRKQIMGMSANEEPSPSDEDNYIRKEIREQEQQWEEEERNSKEKSTSGELQRLVKKSSFSHEDEPTIQHSLPETEEPESKTVSLEGQENVRESEGVRHFKPIEFNNKAGALVRQATDEGDQEVESLTESPEDRSRGEGSSSVHASSFTPGTSPTSVSSLDEDSDSSPSHKRMSSEGKQRKARHRQHGQMLPTIEDSSEEEEMREEEELLRELEMQREVDHQQGKKSSSKKSKKDKEELRAQRRREYPKTPPSNLSPIEDASPTEELRQAAEMEELHKSSCSDYSPSIESEPEGFEINLKKIHTVQEDDQLSTSTSVYSPTDEQQSNVTKDTTRKILKSADEAYEEIMQKAQALEGTCGTQQPPTKLSEDHFGYPDDHYQYDHTGTCDTKVSNGVTPSISENNLGESGLFCEDKNGYGYPNGATEGAVDLTAGKMSTGAIMDYTRKGAGAYSGMTIPQYSQARITPTVGTHFGVNSALRSSNGVVYSSITAPVPSMYAVTTQPGSIFSTTYDALSGMHTHDTMPAVSSLKDQTFSQSYSFLPTTATAQEQAVSQDMGGMSAEFPQVVPTPSLLHDTYTDATLEAIAASLEALASPLTTDDAQQQYQMERDLLELEKIKQLHLAEELEWERLEIQRFREHEQLLVQKELEELQSMKQQLLLQQEEEHQAHLLMQQETYAQQQLQLEQIQQLQQQLQQQLEEQKMRHLYPYGYDPSEGGSPLTSSEQNPLDQQYAVGDNGQYWPVQDGTTTSSSVTGLDLQQNTTWYTIPMEGVAQYITSLPGSTEMPQNENQKHPQLAQRITTISNKKIVDSGVQTDDEDGVDKAYTGRRRRNKKSVDSSVQTDDEDQEDWDIPTRSRRKSRSSKLGSKVSSIAIQTVAEISVQTDSSGTMKRPSVKLDTKLEIGKQGSSLEKTYRGGSVTCQTDTGSGMSSPEKDKRRPTPLEIGYNTHLKADSSLQVAPSPPKSPKVLYSPISPLSPSKSIERVQYDKCVGEVSPQKMLTADQSPRTLKAMQRSISDPRSLSPAEERALSNSQYSDVYSNKGSQSGTPSGTQKKVKRTLPNPPPEEDTAGSQSGYSTGSARRRLCRNTTIARAKILQDIDRELDLVERESSKLRKKQAELDEEEKEIDAKLRYLEMGINRRKDALLKEREKRERAYLQGVAEERDYMSDSEVSNIREPRGGNGHGRERPRTAPQSELNQFIPPQTQAEAQYGQSESPYAQYPYAPQTQATATQYSQQTLYQPSLYHQQVSPYQSQSIYSSVPTLSYPQSSHQASQQQQGYQHSSQLLHLQQKARQATLSDLEPKNTTNYEVIHNQPLMMGSSSADPGYGIPHLGGGKYSSLDLRLGLEERSSMASSPMSSISADSFYADIDHHRNYVLIDDIGELTKGSAGLSSGFSIPDKDLAKADRLLRAAEVRRAAEVSDFLGPLQASSRLHPYGKAEEDSMEEPYELKLLKQQIKQEFRRGADGLDHLTGLPHYYPSESGYRHFPKAEKYSIGRLTLEKQAAKQLPASVLYQKQAKHKKALMDPKVIKFSPIQESRDLEPDYGSYLGSSTSSVSALSSRARFLQDEITFGLRKNIAEQQKYLGSTLGANLAHSLNLGQTLNLGPTMRSSLVDDGTYPSGSRSRPSSRPSSVYGLDLSIKRDSSSSSLRLKADGEPLDASFTVAPTARAKPTSLPISQSRGRIPFVAQNSEEESPLSPVGQPMGMARASAGPLPPISADSRDQFGSSHSLPEVQQHMREESRTRGYDRDIAFMMDDLQGAMSDSEAGGASWDSEAYHLRREETDWFDKPREAPMESTHALDHRQMKPTHYPFPHARVKLQMDPKDRSVSGNGLGIRVVGGKEIPGNSGDIGAYIAKVLPGGAVEQSGQIVEGMQVLEWNGVPLTGKTYEDVQSLVVQQYSGAELCVRLDLNMLSDTEHPQHLELHSQSKAVDRQRSPGVDPKQLAAELQKVSQQQAPSTVTSAMEKGPHLHSGTGSAASSAVPSPGQPGSPSICKKRHSSKSAETVKTQAHPITGEIQLQINYDKNLGNLIVHVLQARNLAPRDNNGYSDPFVKVYLLPGRGAENKRRTKHMQKSLNPEWNQTVIYKNIHLEQLKKKTLEVTVWDYDRFSSNDFLGEVLIDLSNTTQLDNTPRWFPLKEQNEGTTDHGTSRSGSGSQQSPKPSVIKSRSHGIFPDPSKDMQVPTIEKSHSSPGSSKPSLEGQVRPLGPPPCQSKSAVGQAHQEDAGVAIAAAEAAAQQQHGLQPIRKKRRHRHSVDGVPTIQRTQSDYLPAPANENKDTSHLTIRKVMSDGTPSVEGARPGHRATDDSVTTASSVNSLGGNDCNLEGKTQMMGEIKIALKKEMKTEGEQLIVEILQCRNITYKFKTPDHLPDLYVKLYVVNVATQKRVIKKKTRVCRHDREPSFNETFRFALNPAGHSIQLFLVSNGGKFVKKTLIGEAYIWLDKVDLRKRAVSWHKLLASSLQTHP